MVYNTLVIKLVRYFVVVEKIDDELIMVEAASKSEAVEKAMEIWRNNNLPPTYKIDKVVS